MKIADHPWFALRWSPSSAISQQGSACSYGDRRACSDTAKPICSSSGHCALTRRRPVSTAINAITKLHSAKSKRHQCAEAHDGCFRSTNELGRTTSTRNLDIAQGWPVRLDDGRNPAWSTPAPSEDAKFVRPWPVVGARAPCAVPRRQIGRLSSWSVAYSSWVILAWRF